MDQSYAVKASNATPLKQFGIGDLVYYNSKRNAFGPDTMPFHSIIWDLDDDPDGNVQHGAEHGLTKEEVEEAIANRIDEDISHSSGRPVLFGDTTPAAT